MDKLALTTHSISLSMDDNLIIKARESKRIKDCTYVEIKKALGYILVLLGESSTKINDFANSPALQVLTKSLLRAFPILKIEELKTAFELAVDQKLEVNTSLYNRTFNSDYVGKVIKAYQEFRKPTMKIEQLLIDSRDIDPTPEEKKKIAMDGINEAFEIYKKTKQMPDICAWMYIELEKSGTLITPNELKREMWSQAKVILKSGLKAKQSASDGLSLKDIAKRLENIEQDGELKSIARELGLKRHWDEQIKNQN